MEKLTFDKFCGWPLWFAIGLLVFMPFSRAWAQETVPAPAAVDSLNPQTIPPERIPIASGETGLLVLREAESMVSPNQIAGERARTDSLLPLVDSLLALEKDVDLEALDTRSLNNKISFWRGLQAQVDQQKNRLTAMLEELQQSKARIDQELQVWRNTQAVLDTSILDSTTFQTVDEVILIADSINQIIVNRSNEVIALLQPLTSLDVEVDDLLERLGDVIKQREGKILSKTHPSFLEINYSAPYHWELGEYLQAIIDENGQALTNYYQNNKNTFRGYFGFLLVLIVLFFYLRNRSREMKKEDLTLYQRALQRILARPVSAALTLGILSLGLFFKNQPPIMADLIVLLLVVPLLDIGFHISGKRARGYLVVFGVLSLFRFVIDIIPPEILLHRLLLLVSGGLEVIFLLRLIRYLRELVLGRRLFHQFILLLVQFHLVAAVVGIFANLVGLVQLANIAVDLVITNTLVALLLIVSAVTLIGILHLGIDGPLLGRLNFVKNRRDSLKNLAIRTIMFLATLVWLDAFIRLLGISNNFYTSLSAFFSREISLGDFSFSVGKVLLFILVIWLSIIVSRAIRVVLEDDVLSRMTLKKGVPRMISAVITYALITVGVLLAVNAVGMPLDQLTIIFSAFSVGIGFGLQNVVNNFVSGIILLFERPVQLGDTVEVGGLVGVVSSMGIRSSHISTFDGAKVIVPNGHLISNEVVNWTLTDKRRRIEIISGVAYGSDVHKVQQLLLDVIDQHPDVIKVPKPMVLFNNLGESSLDFRMLFWTDKFDDWIRIRSEVLFMVHDTLYREGISIPFPQRDLHIKSIDGNGVGLGLEEKES